MVSQCVGGGGRCSPAGGPGGGLQELSCLLGDLGSQGLCLGLQRGQLQTLQATLLDLTRQLGLGKRFSERGRLDCWGQGLRVGVVVYAGVCDGVGFEGRVL